MKYNKYLLSYSLTQQLHQPIHLCFFINRRYAQFFTFNGLRRNTIRLFPNLQLQALLSHFTLIIFMSIKYY